VAKPDNRTDSGKWTVRIMGEPRAAPIGHREAAQIDGGGPQGKVSKYVAG
jgi:hypothetical protein